MADDAVAAHARGRRVLVVEDDYLIADELRSALASLGAHVLGPAPAVSAALRIISAEPEIDGATLDVTLGREKAFPVADALRARNVPLVFLTGYDEWAVPHEYRAVPRCSKPADVRDLIRSLFGQGAGRH